MVIALSKRKRKMGALCKGIWVRRTFIVNMMAMKIHLHIFRRIIKIRMSWNILK
jgi:hypothetical protein